MITVMSILAATGITGVGFIFLASEDLSIGTVVDQFLSQRQQAAVAQGLDLAASPYESLPGPLGEIAEQYGIFGILRRIFFP